MDTDFIRGDAPDIIIPKKIPIQTPAKVIKCKAGNVRMRCGHCGHYDFGVHVRPEFNNQTASVKELICLRCGHFYKTAPGGYLGGGDLHTRGDSDGSNTSTG